MAKKHTLYAYVYANEYENLMSNNGYWRLKIGDTTHTALYRIKQQIGASSEYDAVILGHWELPQGKRDYHIHEIIRSRGYLQSKYMTATDKDKANGKSLRKRVRGGNEWFECCPLCEVESAVSKLWNAKTDKKKLTIRETQAELINSIVDKIKSNPKKHLDYLIAAVCRFGKNVCMLSIVNELFKFDKSNNNFLYLSYKPFMFSSVEGDIKEFFDFDNIIPINLKSIKDKETFDDMMSSKPNSPKFIIVSAQTLMSEQNGKLEWLKSYRIKTMFSDEIHYGSSSDKYHFLKDEVNPLYDIAVTATPTNDLFKSYDNRFFFTEYDRQMRKCKGDVDFIDAVTPVTFCCYFDSLLSYYIDKVNAESKDEDNDERPNLTSIPGIVESSDVYMVEDLINVIWGEISDEKLKKHASVLNIKTILNNANYEDTLNHGICILPPNTNAIIRFTEIGNRLLGNEYEFIPTTGSLNSNFIENVKNRIAYNDRIGKKTVMCTCYENVEGVNESQWNYVVWLDNTHSASKYFQANGRGLTQNATHTKKYMYIFDYDMNRNIILTDAQVRTQAYKDKRDIDYIIKKRREVMPIYYCLDGEYQQIDTPELYNELLQEAMNTHSDVEYILSDYRSVNTLLKLFDKICIVGQKISTMKFMGTESEIKTDKFWKEYREEKEHHLTAKSITEGVKKDFFCKLRALFNYLPKLAFILDCYKIDKILNDPRYADMIYEALHIEQPTLKEIISYADDVKLKEYMSNIEDDAKHMNNIEEFETKWLNYCITSLYDKTSKKRAKDDLNMCMFIPNEIII